MRCSIVWSIHVKHSHWNLIGISLEPQCNLFKIPLNLISILSSHKDKWFDFVNTPLCGHTLVALNNEINEYMRFICCISALCMNVIISKNNSYYSDHDETFSS